MLFIISLLISFVLQTYEYYNYLAILGCVTIHGNGSEIFKFLNKTYKEKKDFVKILKQKLPNVPSNKILIQVPFEDRKNKPGVSDSFNKFLTINSSSFDKHVFKPKSELFIQVGFVKDQLFFNCNSNFFKNYHDANQCMEDIKKYEKHRYQEQYLGKDLFGKLVWRSTWKNCTYKCFTQLGFKELIGRLLLELNRYRGSFKFDPVKMSYKLYVTAQQFAKRIAKDGFQAYKKYEERPISGVFNVIFKPLASVQMNQWYTEFLLSKKIKYLFKRRNRNLKGLFDRKTRRVGFGIAKTENNLVIVCFYR